MERWVDGGDNGGSEDEDFGWDLVFVDGVEMRCEEWEEGLDGEDGLEEVGIEEVGEV